MIASARRWLPAVALLLVVAPAWADPQGPSAHVLGGAPVSSNAAPDWCPAWVPPDATGPDRDTPAGAGTPFGQMDIAASTQWQPVGGEVEFSIGNVEAQPEHVRVYFAWADSLKNGPAKTCARSPAVRFVKVATPDGGTAYVYAARVPGELGGGTIDGWGHRGKWWSPIPPAAVVFVSAVVPATDRTAARPILLDRLVGITTPWIAFVLAAGAFGVGWWVLRHWARKRGIRGGALLCIISTPDGSASLSQFQILIWTAVIGTGITYVMLLTGNLIDVPETTLALLGVTGAALVGSKLTQPDKPPPRTAGAVPQWSDMVMGGRHDVELDLGRLQMLVFTTIAAAFTGLTLLNNGQIPDIPTGELGLVGLSNGIYLAHKAALKDRSATGKDAGTGGLQGRDPQQGSQAGAGVAGRVGVGDQGQQA